jgi:DNA-binding CsgD family transcriptional regulator
MSPIKLIKPSEYSQNKLLEKNRVKNYDLEEIARHIPGYIHFNSLDDFSLICANKNYEDYFGFSTREISEMGRSFIREHYCAKAWNNALRQILIQGVRNGEQQVFGHVQKIRKSSSLPYRDFICSTRVIKNLNCFITDYIPADFLGIKTKALNAISDCLEFTKTNHDKYYSLSSREKEILHLIGTGKSRNEISNMLYISKHTLDNHRKHIRQKLGIKSTAELFQCIETFDIYS